MKTLHIFMGKKMIQYKKTVEAGQFCRYISCTKAWKYEKSICILQVLVAERALLILEHGG